MVLPIFRLCNGSDGRFDVSREIYPVSLDNEKLVYSCLTLSRAIAHKSTRLTLRCLSHIDCLAEEGDRLSN